MPHVHINESGQYWFRWWLVVYSATSHYLNQCWVIVNWTLGNKLQWNFNQNKKLFFHENASVKIACKMGAILSRGRWVNEQWWNITFTLFQFYSRVQRGLLHLQYLIMLLIQWKCMVMLWPENTCSITGPLWVGSWGEPTGIWQIPSQMFSDVDFDGSLLLAWPSCWTKSAFASDLIQMTYMWLWH